MRLLDLPGTRTFSIVAIGAGFGLLCGLYVRKATTLPAADAGPEPSSVSRADSPDMQVRAQLEEVGRRLTLLANRIDALEAARRIASAATSSAVNEGDAAEARADFDGDRTEDAASDDADSSGRIADLEAMLAPQYGATGWSDAAEREIRDAFEREPAGPGALLDLTCGEAICRVEVGHEATTDNVSAALHQGIGWESESFSYGFDTADGARTTVIYLSRDGHRLD